MIGPIGYYAHHHGSGHLRRARSVAEEFDGEVDILSSLDDPAVTLRLPLDLVDGRAGGGADQGSDLVHWAPRHSRAIVERAAALVEWVRRRRPALVVVDVSVEVTLLMHLLGVPVVVVRQHGDRTDAPHQLAHAAATTLLAPYPNWAEDPTASHAVRAKTVYVGAFSRFDGRPAASVPRQMDETLVMVGTGGSTIDEPAIRHLAEEVGGRWTVVGLDGVDDLRIDGDGVRFFGVVDDPWPLLRRAGVLITSAGHSALSEAAAAGIATIAVAEPRPFDEQRHKVAVLAARGALHAAPPLDHPREWVQAIDAARRGGGSWQNFADGQGCRRTVDLLRTLAAERGDPREPGGVGAS